MAKTAAQRRSPATVTRAEPSGGGCLVQEEGNKDTAEVGGDAPPKRAGEQTCLILSSSSSISTSTRRS